MNNFIKLLRNTELFETRELAVEGLQNKLINLTDGEICTASYGASWDAAKTVFGIVRVNGEAKSYTIFDIDGTIGELNNTDTAVNNQYVTLVEEKAGIVTATRKQPEASEVKYTDGMTVAQTLEKLMSKSFPLSVSCSVTPTTLQEIGITDVNVTINNFIATVGEKAVTITKKTINDIEVTENEYATKISETTTFNIVITTDEGSQTITKTVTFVGPIYVGYSSTTTASETDMKALTKQDLRTALNTITFNGSTSVSGGEYVTIYMPSTFKASKILSTGIDIMGEFATSTFTYQGLDYTCYKHNAKTLSADLTIQ